jgi:hypothetical protein
MLLKDCKAVPNYANHVMHKVAKVQESMILHENKVPYQMGGGIHEHQKFKISYFLRASPIIICKVPN